MSTPDNAHLECYLILEASGPNWKPAQKVKADRVTQKAPDLSHRQRALKLSLDIPRSLFATPQLAASIRVPDDAVSAPTIEAEVIADVQELVSRELGVNLRISVVGDVQEFGL